MKGYYHSLNKTRLLNDKVLWIFCPWVYRRNYLVASLNKNTLSRKLTVADKWQWSGSSSTAVTTENICTGQKKYKKRGGGGGGGGAN